MTKRRYGPEAELNAIAHTISDSIHRISALNACGDYSQIMTWVIDKKLACATRPLRCHHIYGGSGKTLPVEAKPDLDRWIQGIKGGGIVSIIALVSKKELSHYRLLFS